MAELSAADLIAERNDPAASFVVISGAFSHPDFTARSVTLRDATSAEVVLAAVHEAALRKTAPPVRRVVLLGAEVIDSRVLAVVLNKAASAVPVYVFSGKGAQYAAALKDHQAMWAHRDTSPPLRWCNPS